jgi:LPXTG-motif cell wall-anchored protein
VPQYFGKPQSYAPFLQREIAFNTRKPLLVVMPAGYGAAALPIGTEGALQGLKAPTSGGGSALGRSTVEAILRLSKAGGHPVAAPKLPEAGGGGASPLIVFGVPVALLALGGVLAALRRRQHPPAEA